MSGGPRFAPKRFYCGCLVHSGLCEEAIATEGCLSARMDKLLSLLYFRQDCQHISIEEVSIALGKKGKARLKLGTQLSQ